MHLRKHFAPLFLLILTPCFVFAQSSSPQSKSKKIDHIIMQLGMEEQLASTPDELQTQFEQNPFDLPENKNEQMLKLYKKAYQKEALLNDFRAAFEKDYQPEQAKAVATWLQTPDAQTLLNTQKEFHTIQGMRKQVVTRYEMDKHPATVQRKALMDSLAAVTSASTTNTEGNVIIFRSFVKAFSQLSDQQHFSADQIEAITQNYRAQVEKQGDAEVSGQYLVSYRQLNDAAIQPNLTFYKTKAGKWLTQTITQSMEMAYKSAANRFVTAVKNIDTSK